LGIHEKDDTQVKRTGKADLVPRRSNSGYLVALAATLGQLLINTLSRISLS
jgi:hypothetical protein